MPTSFRQPTAPGRAPGLRPPLLLAPLSALFAAQLAWPAAAQATLRVSLDSLGGEADHLSRAPSISDDGRYVAFESWAANLVPGDSNASLDVFVRDTLTDATTRASVSSSGAQGNHNSEYATISADGRYVCFSTRASNLVAGDNNTRDDVFVRDRLAGTTSLVSVATDGTVGDWTSYQPRMSGDSRWVAFVSFATDLTGTPTTGAQVFLRDRQAGTTELISVTPAGTPSGGGCSFPWVSDNGRYVAFSSVATDLVPDDTNGAQDLFLRDRATGTTTRLDLTSEGEQTGAVGAQTWIGGMSSDGRYAVYRSGSGNIVPGDTNGYPDVFYYDRQTGIVQRISVDAEGNQGNFPSMHPRMSSDGRLVVFRSGASNLVPDDVEAHYDVFLRDTWTGTIRRVSLAESGLGGDGNVLDAAITRDGRHVAYGSEADDVVPGDTNGQADVFRGGPIPHDPAPDVRLNGQDGPLELAVGTPVSITIALDAGDATGQVYDWWVWAETPAGNYWYLVVNWFPSAQPLPLYFGWPITFPAFPILSGVTLPPGEYEVHFALDPPDGTLQGTYHDSVVFEIL